MKLLQESPCTLRYLQGHNLLFTTVFPTQVLHQHRDADKLVALMELYEEEDETYWELVTVATQFYQYLLQPFRDMRELATLYKLEILVGFSFWISPEMEIPAIVLNCAHSLQY